MAAAAALVAAGCSSSSTPQQAPARTPPNLHAFLRLPVASPSSCPPDVSGSTAGRRSPWVRHVDISVFVRDDASDTAVARLHRALVATPHIARVYTETRKQAWEEFRRLYTCSAQVPRSAVSASFRLVVADGTTQAERDQTVARIRRLPAVHSVSCDPSDPCLGNAGSGG